MIKGLTFKKVSPFFCFSSFKAATNNSKQFQKAAMGDVGCRNKHCPLLGLSLLRPTLSSGNIHFRAQSGNLS